MLKRRRPKGLLLAMGSLAFLPVASACGGETAGSGDGVAEFNGDCAKVTVPAFGEVESGILSYCVGCHGSSVAGSARHGAPDVVNFDSYDAAKAAALQAVPMVKRRLMPYPSGAGPTDSERNQLYEWALCGTPR